MAKIKTPNKVMLHHSAIPLDNNFDQAEATNNYHKRLWNFRSSLGKYGGYNYEISGHGKVTQFRVPGEATAACYQNNMNDGRCVHIALDGNFDRDKPEPAQIFALRDLLRDLKKDFDFEIVFHRDYADKTCPGMNIEIDFIKGLLPEETKKKDQIKSQIIELIKQL